MSFTSTTVTFTFLNANGQPASGTVSFRLTTPITDGTDIVVNDLRVVSLDANGYGSVVLPANDDPTTVPARSGYIVTEKIQNASPRTYNIILNCTQPGHKVDLSNLAPATSQVLYPTMGAQGAQGPQGFQGTAGQGAQGPQGTQGSQGSTGAQGPQGSTGSQGAQGPQGTQGSQGSTGAQGPQGFQGTQGPQGFQGTQGTQGNQGTQGTQGNQGAQGVQGVQGSTGAQGVTGAQGSTGAQGPQGFQGTQGPQGFQGTQGAVGVSNTSWASYSTTAIGVQSGSTINIPTSVNVTGGFNYYLVTVSAVQTVAATNSGTIMSIGYQAASYLGSTPPSISVDGNFPSSTTSGTHRFCSVGNSNSGLQTGTYSTMLAAATTAAFTLTGFVQLSATPGATPPNFAYWTLTVVGMN